MPQTMALHPASKVRPDDFPRIFKCNPYFVVLVLEDSATDRKPPPPNGGRRNGRDNSSWDKNSTSSSGHSSGTGSKVFHHSCVY